MVASPALLYFDTNVVAQLKAKSDVERRTFWNRVHARYRYAIVPSVIAEILKSLRRDPEAHLQSVKRELSMLRGPGEPTMLPLQGFFLRRTLFELEGDHLHVPADKWGWVLDQGRRTKRIARRNGRTLLVESDIRGAIILDVLLDPIEKGEESMFAALETTKADGASPLSAEEWARDILVLADIPSTVENARILAPKCGAAYAYQRFLWQQAARNYNPRKHPGDWMDWQLLLYLAHDGAVFVTCESQLPKRIAGSGQEDRVRSFESLWAESQQ